MASPLYLLAVLLWIPVFARFLGSVVWNMRLWQSSGYILEKFWYLWRWDYEPGNKHWVLNIAKIFGALSLASILLTPDSILPALGLGILFATWCAEGLNLLQKVLQHAMPLQVVGWRELTVIAAAAWLNLSIAGVLLISWILQPANVMDLNGFVMPTFYIYLVSLGLTGIVLEFTSPLATLLAVLFTSPFATLRHWIYLELAREKLHSHPGLVLAVVTGDLGKSVALSYAAQLSGHDLALLKPKHTFNTVHEMSEWIFRHLAPHTKVVLAELNLDIEEEITQLQKLGGVQLLVATGTNPGLSPSSLLESLSPNGVLIANSDLEYGKQLLALYPGRRLAYSVANNFVQQDELASSIQLQADFADSWVTIKLDGVGMTAQLPLHGSKLQHSLLAGIGSAYMLGSTLEELSQRLPHLQAQHSPWDLWVGDNQTILLCMRQRTTLTSIQTALHQLHHIDGKDKYLVIGGLAGNPAEREKKYKRLLAAIQAAVQVVITFDPVLIKVLEKENVNLELVKVGNYSHMLYAIRKRLEPTDVILLSTDVSLQILANLRSN